MIRDMELERLRRPITVAEYHKMHEAGIFGPNERTELIRGEIYRKMSVGNWHRGTVNRLNQMLVLAFQGRAVVQIQNPIVLDEYSEPEPDVVLLRDNDAAFGSRSVTPDDAFAAIEVADSSKAFDLRVKVPLYAETAIREMWVVDRRSRGIRVHRDPSADGYGLVSIARPGTRIAFDAFPQTSFDVADILGPEPSADST